MVNRQTSHLRLITIMIGLLLLTTGWCSASESVITTGEGVAALGNDKTRNETMNEALSLAKRNAAENAATYIQTVTEVKDFTLKKDLVNAFAEAKVTVLKKVDSGWQNDPRLGESFHVVIKAEVSPTQRVLDAAGRKASTPAADWADNPAAPLTVKLTSPKTNYVSDEKITFYIKGNKPFFARVVYEDCEGNLIQILPNPYRTRTYFQGGITYSLPSGEDEYMLAVIPPFGKETITVYAATQPLGDVAKTSMGSVYQLNDNRDNVATHTRGIQLKTKDTTVDTSAAAEFFETSMTINTRPGL